MLVTDKEMRSVEPPPPPRPLRRVVVFIPSPTNHTQTPLLRTVTVKDFGNDSNLITCIRWLLYVKVSLSENLQLLPAASHHCAKVSAPRIAASVSRCGCERVNEVKLWSQLYCLMCDVRHRWSDGPLNTRCKRNQKVPIVQKLNHR